MILRLSHQNNSCGCVRRPTSAAALPPKAAPETHSFVQDCGSSRRGSTSAVLNITPCNRSDVNPGQLVMIVDNRECVKLLQGRCMKCVASASSPARHKCCSCGSCLCAGNMWRAAPRGKSGTASALNSRCESWLAAVSAENSCGEAIEKAPPCRLNCRCCRRCSRGSACSKAVAPSVCWASAVAGSSAHCDNCRCASCVRSVSKVGNTLLPMTDSFTSAVSCASRAGEIAVLLRLDYTVRGLSSCWEGPPGMLRPCQHAIPGQAPAHAHHMKWLTFDFERAQVHRGLFLVVDDSRVSACTSLTAAECEDPRLYSMNTIRGDDCDAER